MPPVISVKNLTKRYGRTNAVNDVSFHVSKGETFGLLGENGAGKTTTLEIIEGLRRPSAGRVTVLGHDTARGINSIKEKIGVQLQSSAYYNFLTLNEILAFFCSLYKNCLNPKDLLGLVELSDKANSYVSNLSGGQRQRFSIIASLVNDPEIVFLDEPTTGLDPLARRNLWKLISEIKSRGKTIILTTHYMEEAELLCDRVAIMEKGRILAMDETHKLIARAKNPYKISFISPKVNKEVFKRFVALGEIENTFGKVNQFELKICTQPNLNRALQLVNKLNPESLTVGRARLEDIFIELTGKTIADEE